MDFTKMKKDLADSEAKLTDKLGKCLANRKSANAQCKSVRSATKESDEQCDKDMEETRVKLAPYLDGRKKMDAGALKLAHEYDRMVKDKRLLQRSGDMLDETITGAELNEIGPESDGKTQYRNIT